MEKNYKRNYWFYWLENTGKGDFFLPPPWSSDDLGKLNAFSGANTRGSSSLRAEEGCVSGPRPRAEACR